MTDYAALVQDLHDKYGDLDAVADALGWSKGTWSLIANGKRDPTRAQMNAIRAAVGLDLLPPEPVEFRLHDEPDAALLVNLDGKAPSSVTIRTGRESGLTSASDCRVAIRNSAPKRSIYTSVSVKHQTKERLTGAKIRHGGTWDEFMNDIAKKLEGG